MRRVSTTRHHIRRAPRTPQAHRRGAVVIPARLVMTGLIGAVVIVVLASRPADRPPVDPAPPLAATQASPAASPNGRAGSTIAASSVATAQALPTALPTASSPTAPSPIAPSPTPGPTSSSTNLYAGAGIGMFSTTVASYPERVYVPDEATGTVVVIDPRTYRIVGRYPVGASPEHVTPDWDLKRLYVEAAFGGRLTVIDPKSGKPIGVHRVPGPYNLYFTLDGRMAIVVLDSAVGGVEYGGQKQLRFYDRRSWRLIKALDVPWAGADHLDFSADGRFFLLSTEYSGRLVKVDVRTMTIVGAFDVGGRPIDVRLAPDGRAFYVANQTRNGVSIIDATGRRELKFLPTGLGAHGLAISRDARRLFVTNRRAGTLSVIDFATRRVVHTGGSAGRPTSSRCRPTVGASGSRTATAAPCRSSTVRRGAWSSSSGSAAARTVWPTSRSQGA